MIAESVGIEAGRLWRVTQPDPDGSGNPLTAPVTQLHYTPGGQVDQTIDPMGLTRYSYDQMNRPVETIEGFGTSLQRTTTYTYNETSGTLASVIAHDPDGTGPLPSPLAQYQYDALRRLIGQDQPDPDGAGVLTAPHITYSKDVLDRITSLADPQSNVTSWKYDALGRMTHETNTLNAVTTNSLRRYSGRPREGTHEQSRNVLLLPFANYPQVIIEILSYVTKQRAFKILVIVAVVPFCQIT